MDNSTDECTKVLKNNTPCKQWYLIDIITICPTQDCKDCTGSISNELFNHRFVCMCPCHTLAQEPISDTEMENTRGVISQ